MSTTTANNAATINVTNAVEDLCINSDYTISTVYPYTITRKSTKHVVTRTIDRNSGYVKVAINGKPESLHRLIALQWIPIPEHIAMIPTDELEVDHKDKVRSNFHIENLEWVTRSENSKNKTKYKDYTPDYVNHLSSSAIPVTEYNDHTIADLYYDNGEFYYKAYDTEYRRIEQNYNNNKNPTLYISYRDIDNKRISITVTKFKEIYNVV